MRKQAFALVGSGLLLVAVSVWADSLGLGRETGLGGKQMLGILTGVALLLLGVGLLRAYQGDAIDFRENFKNVEISNLPLLFWVLVTFFFAYLSFFLAPVFFSSLRIEYLTKYIPDAHITRIGFDIEAIISRIENWLETGQSPYSDSFIAYPPLAIVIFSTFSILGYPAYFKLIVGLTLLAYLGTAMVVPWLLISKRNRILLMLFFVSGLFSYGLQFEQERGQFNLITFAFTLFAIYLFHFHPRFRFFAYLLFTLSVQLKIYPVFFAVMLIDDWSDWRGIIRRFLGLGLINFLLLFILGRKLFLDFIRVITAYQFLESSRVENLSIKGFFSYLSSDRFGTTNWFISLGVTEAFFWFLLALCLFAIIAHTITHNIQGLNVYLLLVCTIAALIVPSVSNDYKLSILIAPVTLMFCNLPEDHPFKRRFLFILLVILASFAYWTTLFPAIVKPELLARNFPALMVILVSATVLYFLTPYSSRKNIQRNPQY